MRFHPHHIGIATEDAHLTARQWTMLGYHVVRRHIHDKPQGVYVWLLSSPQSDVLIELLEPDTPDSPAQQFTKTGYYHMCFEVSNLDLALEYVGATGWKVIQVPGPAAAFDNRRIAWCYNKQIIELLES